MWKFDEKMKKLFATIVFLIGFWFGSSVVAAVIITAILFGDNPSPPFPVVLTLIIIMMLVVRATALKAVAEIVDGIGGNRKYLYRFVFGLISFAMPYLFSFLLYDWRESIQRYAEGYFVAGLLWIVVLMVISARGSALFELNEIFGSSDWLSD